MAQLQTNEGDTGTSIGILHGRVAKLRSIGNNQTLGPFIYDT